MYVYVLVSHTKIKHVGSTSSHLQYANVLLTLTVLLSVYSFPGLRSVAYNNSLNVLQISMQVEHCLKV